MLPMVRRGRGRWRREGGDFDGLDGGEAGVDEEFDLALVSEAGEDSAVAGGVGAGEEEAAGGDEFALQSHACWKSVAELVPSGRVAGRLSSRLRV